MEPKKDLRIIKTENLLYDTLVKLMKNTPFEKIKVSDICNLALINRSTFYAHYNDKYELLVDLIENLKENLRNALDKNEHIVNTKNYYIEMIKLLMDHIDEKKDIYYSILISNRNSIVIDILLEAVITDVNKRVENTNVIKNNLPTNVVSRFYLGAVVSLGIEWLNGKYTKNEIIDYLTYLIPETI